MDILLEDEPDRQVEEIYAWVCTDLRTGLEGLFGLSLHGGTFQAVTSTKKHALAWASNIKRLPFAGKKFRLVRFVKADVIADL